MIYLPGEIYVLLVFLDEELASVKTFLAASQTEENKLKTQVVKPFYFQMTNSYAGYQSTLTKP